MPPAAVVRVKSLTGGEYAVDLGSTSSSPGSVVTCAELKALLVSQHPDLATLDLKFYAGGRKLGSKSEVRHGDHEFITLVCSGGSKAGKKRPRPVADVGTGDDALAEQRKEEALSFLQDALEKRSAEKTESREREEERSPRAAASATTTQPRKRKPPASGTLRKKLELPIPPCLERAMETFQEISVVVGFLYHQGLQPTLSGLQRLAPSLDADLLDVMQAFAPGVITTRTVSSLPQYSDAARGRLGATHGALAETGTSYDAGKVEVDDFPPETIVNLHAPCPGAGPRIPRQSALESQKLEWTTVTGGMTYGGLVFSKEEGQGGEGEGQGSGGGNGAPGLLPSFIQGSRSSSHTIGPAGLASIKNEAERGKMASKMKQTIMRWQSYFRQALLEITLFLHDDFVAERNSHHTTEEAKEEEEGEAEEKRLDHDPLKKEGWHPDFPLAELKLEDVMDFARKSLARESRLMQKRSQPKELKGTFKPCKTTEDMDVKHFVSHLLQRASSATESRVAYLKDIPGRQARSMRIPFEAMFSDEIARAIRSIGIQYLYSHQESAIAAVKEGKNVIVTTPTASGKSICYNAPILDDLVTSDATALYIFPTKALAQDQLRALQVFCKDVTAIDSAKEIGVYDGDTSHGLRTDLMAQARILICNPDILHVTVLPRHKEFARFLSKLSHVVLDEAHAYRGVFGSHVSLVLRRMRRILDRVYGKSPQFFLSSATIANSVAHAQNLMGLYEWTRVKNDGSPCGDKTFLLWNPPLRMSAKRNRKKLLENNEKANIQLPTTTTITAGETKDNEAKAQEEEAGGASENTEASHRYNAWRGRQLQRKEARRAEERLEENKNVRTRLSPIMEMGMLFAECVQHNLKCIAFCKTRKLSELVLTYARQILEQMDSERGKAIAAYRAGYSADHRRAIEGSLFNGNLKGVAATNALELGIDVGALDVTLHLGFPGTVSSLWQQAGRAGRREQKALSIYVAFDGALDQFFMRNPEKLFEAPIEHASVDYQNPMLLEQHLVCACNEFPLMLEGDPNDVEYFGSTAAVSILDAQKRCLLGRNPECAGDKRWFYIGKSDYGPAALVNLRAIDEKVWTVFDEVTQKVVEEIEESKAFFQVYEGAVYMQQGKKFLCTHLDTHNRVAKVRRADLKYYTSIRQHTDVSVTGGQSGCAYPERPILPSNETSSMVVPYGSSALLEPARHSVSFVGFMKVWQQSGVVFDHVDLTLPNVEYNTICTWIRIPDKARSLVEKENRELRAGVHAAAHALLNVLPLYLMCNVADAGVECVNENETRWKPERLLIYDRQPGGTGISAQVQPLFGNILRAAYELVNQCPCEEESGCPNCVHHGECTQYNAVLDKRAAKIVLEAVIEAEGTYLSKMEEAAKNLRECGCPCCP